MKNIINLKPWTIIITILIIIFIAIAAYFILNINLEKQIEGILEIDEEKNIKIFFDKINYYDLKKISKLSFFIDGKKYFNNNFKIEFDKNDNVYYFIFNNENIENLFEANSKINVLINGDTKKLFQIILNIK
ncbi:MAG: MAG1140 family protein [Metamycoplasmataceae bacterium]